MKRAILHIGMMKTGTTSIQECLTINDEKLKRAGIFYPESTGRPRTVQFTTAMTRLEKNVNNFQKENGIVDRADFIANRWRTIGIFWSDFIESGCDTAVLSCEEMSLALNSKASVKFLQLSFSELDVTPRAVLYVRPQAEHFLSLYWTELFFGSRRRSPFDVDDRNSSVLDLYKLHSRWKNVFGASDVLVRVFNKNKLHRGSSVHDFLHEVLGLSDIYVDEYLTIPESRNASPDIAGLSAMRLLNAAPENFPTVERRQLAKFVQSHRWCNRLVASPVDVRKFQKRFDDSNIKFAESAGIEIDLVTPDYEKLERAYDDAEEKELSDKLGRMVIDEFLKEQRQME